MNKLNLYLERFWLIVSILLTIVQLIYSIQEGFGDRFNTFLWLFVALSWAVFFIRRGVRKRMEKYAAAEKSNKKK
ncbi:MAG: hypothetical protein H6598_00865 [Flavobacteriales bacterium]|nr:hypothetical protein [Flavobacteriales bacterium]